MKVLVVNAGSSSLKYQLFDMDTETVLAKGICERIGTGSPAGCEGLIEHKVNGRVYKEHPDARSCCRNANNR